MIEPHCHIAKARKMLAQAQYLLEGGFTGGAGRDSYMAALHASLAYIVARTHEQPRTHSGTRAEFSRLARDDQRISRAFSIFLATGYELKATADYDDGEPLTSDEA